MGVMKGHSWANSKGGMTGHSWEQQRAKSTVETYATSVADIATCLGPVGLGEKVLSLRQDALHLSQLAFLLHQRLSVAVDFFQLALKPLKLLLHQVHFRGVWGCRRNRVASLLDLEPILHNLLLEEPACGTA
jgi:hypothetical protein